MCLAPSRGRKWPFPGLIRVWTASLHGPAYQLQTAEGHIQTHSSHHRFKRKEPSIFPSRVLTFILFKQGWKSRCFNCVCFQLSSAGLRSKNYTGNRYFHIILRLTHSACLNYLWNQTFRSMWRQYPVLLPYCMFSSLYSKYRALAPSKTHMDYCVFPQIFEEGVRYLGAVSDLAPGRCPDEGEQPDYTVHKHVGHILETRSCKVRVWKKLSASLSVWKRITIMFYDFANATQIPGHVLRINFGQKLWHLHYIPGCRSFF